MLYQNCVRFEDEVRFGLCVMASKFSTMYKHIVVSIKRQLLLHFSSNLDQSCYIGSLGVCSLELCSNFNNRPGALGGALTYKRVNLVKNKLLLQCDSCERIKAHGPLVIFSEVNTFAFDFSKFQIIFGLNIKRLFVNCQLPIVLIVIN